MAVSATFGRALTARTRWIVLGVLLAIAVVSLGVAGWGVWSSTAEGSPSERIEALQDAPADPVLEREQLLGVARDFVVGFNTYGPDLLADDGTMPDYAALGESMTAKFRTVFDQNVAVAAQTVAETSVRRSAEVYAVGIVTADEDSAELLVAGTATFAYPNPKKDGAWVEFDPERFRYQVSLVKQRDAWLVDDLDDLDDDLPSFADSEIAELPGGDATPAPSESATPPGDDRKRDGGEDR